jgi:hypothetical protein
MGKIKAMGMRKGTKGTSLVKSLDRLTLAKIKKRIDMPRTVESNRIECKVVMVTAKKKDINNLVLGSILCKGDL